MAKERCAGWVTDRTRRSAKLLVAAIWVVIGVCVPSFAQLPGTRLLEVSDDQLIMTAPSSLNSSTTLCLLEASPSFYRGTGDEGDFTAESVSSAPDQFADGNLQPQGDCGPRVVWTKDMNSGMAGFGGASEVASLSLPSAVFDDADQLTSQLELAAVNEPTDDLARYSSSLGAGISLVELPRNPPEKFHWGPALRESFYFLLFEHAFRVANDPYARYLIWHKPFWHDYFASASHFDMGRWGDGDDFLVNYIAHPMEGAVSGYIQIQNDPKGRGLKFSNTPAYWKSRLKAMAWAAAYSTYFEIGPVLSETALGSEGGYTYIKGCDLPCTKPVHRPPTNNTGWVDFVVTPVVGMGWIVLEDAIERGVVDRLSKGSNALRFELLRSVLAPSRSFANFFQGREPWYRPKPVDGNVFFVTKAQATAAGNGGNEPIAGRRQIGIQYTSLNLPMDREGCSSCRVSSSGVGVSLGYRITPWLAFDSQGNYFPGGGGYGVKGSATEGLFGAKLGKPFNSWGVFATIRPGFIHYEKTLTDATTREYESTNRFALDLGGTFEYYVSKRGALRFEIGNTLVRYLSDQPDPRQPVISVLSSDNITTHSNFHIGTGYVVRF